LKVKVFPFFNTSLKVKVLKHLLKYIYFYFVTVQHWTLPLWWWWWWWWWWWCSRKSFFWRVSNERLLVSLTGLSIVCPFESSSKLACLVSLISPDGVSLDVPSKN